jgi:hypothetical protein
MIQSYIDRRDWDPVGNIRGYAEVGYCFPLSSQVLNV